MVFGNVETLSFNGLAWTAADWRHMGGALPCCTKLKSLSLFEMGMDDAAMIALCGDLGSGAAPALTTLDLGSNQIGGKGLGCLGDVLARGALPALKQLALANNPASEAFQQAVERACKDRWLDGEFFVEHLSDARVLGCGGLGWGDEEVRKLAAALAHAHAQGIGLEVETLHLHGNGRIGDEGLGYLCDVLERGVMEKLEKLGLSGNKIGSEGLVRLGDVLAKGGAAALKEVGLEGNPAGEATVQALQGALRDRATFAAVQNVYLPRLR